MEMRTRILPRMLNDEVENYLDRNDIIIVPVGTVELHGGFPLDSETVISEAVALKIAEACDGLVLTGLPYFYAGATASGRGTVQVSVRTGIDYLYEIAESLYRQGFKRQIYISAHGPAHMTISPVMRDFQDKYGTPILYMDMGMQLLKNASQLFTSMDSFHAMTVGAYEIMGRLSDIPLTTAYEHQNPSTAKRFSVLTGLAYESGAAGYYFGEKEDHMSTPAIPTEEKRAELAKEGVEVIEKLVKFLEPEKLVAEMRELETYNEENMKKYPWTPAAFHRENP